MLLQYEQEVAQAGLVKNAGQIDLFSLRNSKTLHTHKIQQEDSLSLKPNKKTPNKQRIKIPSFLGITTIIPIEPIISNLPNIR